MCNEWRKIESAPRDGRVIKVKGGTGPYGVTSWEGRAKWYLPKNWHKDETTWADPEGRVLTLAGYLPTHWMPEDRNERA